MLKFNSSVASTVSTGSWIVVGQPSCIFVVLCGSFQSTNCRMRAKKLPPPNYGKNFEFATPRNPKKNFGQTLDRMRFFGKKFCFVVREHRVVTSDQELVRMRRDGTRELWRCLLSAYATHSAAGTHSRSHRQTTVGRVQERARCTVIRLPDPVVELLIPKALHYSMKTI